MDLTKDKNMKKNIRKVHINNEEWHYMAGSGGGLVTIYAPNSKIPIKLNGQEWHKIGNHITVTPQDVKDYIVCNLVPKRLKEGIE